MCRSSLTAPDSSIPKTSRKRQPSPSIIQAKQLYKRGRRGGLIADIGNYSHKDVSIISERWSRPLFVVCTRTTYYVSDTKYLPLCLVFDNISKHFQLEWNGGELFAIDRPIRINPLKFKKVLRSGCGAKVRLKAFTGWGGGWDDETVETRIIDIGFKDFLHAVEFMEKWNTVRHMKFIIVEE